MNKNNDLNTKNKKSLNNWNKGKIGQEMAKGWYLKNGYKLVQENYEYRDGRGRLGEIDLIFEKLSNNLIKEQLKPKNDVQNLENIQIKEQNEVGKPPYSSFQTQENTSKIEILNSKNCILNLKENQYSPNVLGQKILIFVEVKLRNGNRFGIAHTQITPAKLNFMQKSATHFLLTHPHFKNHFCRFDATFIQNGQLEIIPNIF